MLTEPLQLGGQVPGPVTLDTDTEPWVATFPGLGTVRVAADGQVIVDATDAPVAVHEADETRVTGDVGVTGAAEGVEPEDRAEALRWGWGEPLSWFRRGYHLTGAGAVAPDGRGLIVVGAHPQDVVVLKQLSEIGWSVLADCMTPIRETEAGFEICGRAAPVLVAAGLAEKWGMAGSRVRAGSDVVAVELPSHKGPVEVAGVLQVMTLGMNDPTGLEELSGTSRLQLATGLVQRAPASSDDLDAAAIMVRDMRLARLPMIKLHVADRQPKVDISEVVAWWKATN